MQDIINKILLNAKSKIETGTAKVKQYECPLCEDTEWVIRKDENGNEYASHCKCFEKKQAKRLMLNSGLSEEDTKKGFTSFETFNEQELVTAKNKAIEYARSFDTIRQERNNSLLLCGASGRGKTTLGMAVANNLIHKCVYVRYMPYREEVTKLKQIIVDEQQYNDHMYKLKTCSVLFIDDLLKGKVTESDVNIVYEIINHRYLSKLPMIISTEKTPQELIDFDEAIGGRILEMCKGHAALFTEKIPNYRMRDFF